jgi:ATP-binding cassette subfamily C (CFTR/MRP) protein 1
MALEQGSRVVTDVWVGWWAADRFGLVVWAYVGIYAGLGVFYSLTTFIRWVAGYLMDVGL